MCWKGHAQASHNRIQALKNAGVKYVYGYKVIIYSYYNQNLVSSVRRYNWSPGLHVVSEKELKEYAISIDFYNSHRINVNAGFHLFVNFSYLKDRDGLSKWLTQRRNNRKYQHKYKRALLFRVTVDDLIALGNGQMVAKKVFLCKREYERALARMKPKC